jgi:1-acyl-sn-glycerol-3-phosphate acyltransferase
MFGTAYEKVWAIRPVSTIACYGKPWFSGAYFFDNIPTGIYFHRMVYKVLRLWVKLGVWFFTKKVSFNKHQPLREKGPLLLACNHPNSFLDAILLGVYMDEPVHYITRGDVFKKPAVRKFLESLHMIPIFRMRDGKDKLAQNDEAFTKSVEVLRNNGILLIFVEGFCINQTELLLPLKKGAPRILQSCWQEGIPVRVLPVWLKYSSFNRFGKTIQIRFGEAFNKSVAENQPTPAAGILKINAETERQLLQLSTEVSTLKPTSIFARIVLLIPAMLGAVLHAPLYLPLLSLDKKISKDTVHYDAIMLALLTFLYPVYLLLVTGILYAITGIGLGWSLLLIMPLLIKAYTWWKK